MTGCGAPDRPDPGRAGRGRRRPAPNPPSTAGATPEGPATRHGSAGHAPGRRRSGGLPAAAGPVRAPPPLPLARRPGLRPERLPPRAPAPPPRPGPPPAPSSPAAVVRPAVPPRRTACADGRARRTPPPWAGSAHTRPRTGAPRTPAATGHRPGAARLRAHLTAGSAPPGAAARRRGRARRAEPRATARTRRPKADDRRGDRRPASSSRARSP